MSSRASCFFISAIAILLACASVMATDVFGFSTRNEAALIGILYDLKQDQKRQPINEDFQTLLGEFIRDGWNEDKLNRFYRATRALYTTQVFVPLFGADHAPKAFGVEDIMEPRQWVIHYKGQVRPSVPGTYRFVGMSDDLLAVAVDGRTVLIAEHDGSRLKDHGWREAPRDQVRTSSGPSVAGDWFTVAAGEIIDLDVLIGERPGGEFGAWLMIQKQGVDYERDPEGKEILPAFQLGECDVPASERCGRKSKPDELWFGVQ